MTTRRSIYSYDEDYNGLTKTYVGWYDTESSYILHDDRDCNHAGMFIAVTKSGALVKCHQTQWANEEDSCESINLSTALNTIGLDRLLRTLACAGEKGCACKDLLVELQELLETTEK